MSFGPTYPYTQLYPYDAEVVLVAPPGFFSVPEFIEGRAKGTIRMIDGKVYVFSKHPRFREILAVNYSNRPASRY